jgi:hypothetical protein
VIDPLRELDRLERQEKLRLWRNALLMAGILLCAIAVTTVVSSAGNPKTWASAYAALANAGVLTWLALPLLALGVIFLIVGWVLAVLLAREP